MSRARPNRGTPARTRRRTPWVVVGAGLCLVVAVAGTALSVTAHRAQARSQAVVAPVVERGGTSALQPAPEPLPTPPGTTERASAGADGREGDAASGGVSAFLASANGDQAISADGTWVAFASAATNLIPERGHPAGGLFLRDRQSRTTIAVPWVDGGPFPLGVSAAEPALSNDAGVVAFTAVVTPEATAGALVRESTTPYVLAWDRQTNVTEPVSVDANRLPIAGYQPSISGDGRYVAYTAWSLATPPPDAARPVLTGLNANPTCIDDTAENGSSRISVDASDDVAVAGVTITITPPGAQRVQAEMSHAGGNTWTYTVTSSPSWLDGGYVRYSVVARDSSGNISDPASDDASTSNFLQYLKSGCTIL